MKSKAENDEERHLKVNALLVHPGWKYVDLYIDRELLRQGSLKHIKIKGKDNNEILREMLEKKIIIETLLKFRSYIKNISKEGQKWPEKKN